MAMAVTQFATAAAALAWMFAEWMTRGKPSVLGIVSGAVAGLVAITPASGFVNPTGALVIGIVAGLICFWGATGLKHAMGYDDSLDAFGVHGVGGFVGAHPDRRVRRRGDRRRRQEGPDRRQCRPGPDPALGLPGLHGLVRDRHLRDPQARRRPDRAARRRPRRRSRASTSTCTERRCTDIPGSFGNPTSSPVPSPPLPCRGGSSRPGGSPPGLFLCPVSAGHRSQSAAGGEAGGNV